MASGPGGYGRGGRGAALLQALSQPTRKPGDDPQQQQQTQPGPGGAAAPVPSQPSQPSVSVPVGRGAYLAGLFQGRGRAVPTPAPPQQQPGDAALPPTQPVMSTPVQAPPAVRPQIPMGRGLASMQALLQASGVGMSPPAAPSAQSPPSPARSQPSPRSPQQQAHGDEGRGPPTSRLARMSMEERKPVVHRSGTDGKPMPLSANYIRINTPKEGAFQYHVSFSPEVDSRNMRYKMMHEHQNVIGSVKAFDGTVLFLPIRLEQREPVVTSQRHTDGTTVTISIVLTKVLEPEMCVQLYNIIFRRVMNILQMVQVGRYYYNPKTPSSVPQHKLEVWPGYITSVQEHEGGVLLLADASHRVLRTETVLDVMQQIVQRNPQGFQDEVTRKLVGTIVLTRYNNKTYKVDDIVWDKTPTHNFTSASTGESITFIDYYRKAYNKEIRDYEQPLLLNRPKRPKREQEKGARAEVICLIPELCYCTGLTDELRSDFRVMKDLATHTRVTPNQRLATMGKFVDSVNNTPEARKELDNWRISLSQQTVDIDGRQLAMEKINFQNCHVMAGPEADWGRDATRNKVISAVPLRTWFILYVKRDQSKANDFVQMAMKTAPQMGIDCAPPTRIELRDDRTETVVRSIRENINEKVQMVVIVCPTSRDDRYSAIKKLTCVECPVPSQVINARTISQQQKLRSVTQKIVLQINCKLGGELWALDIPMKRLMVVGIDVYHDATRGKRSIAGFVASTNKLCTRWFSKVYFQPAGSELIDGLKMMLIQAIKKYHEVNHELPEKIIVFRDGVSDGQLSTVAGYEIQQLHTCFGHFDNYEPRLAVVIVQKRINTRIFLKKGHQMDNPPPGSIVDHTITRRNWYDFFLVSQHVRQGTVTPTHYIVVHDGSGLKPDHMQRLAYKMTHLYYNWPGTVRVPAPCQYAHKLAYLVGQNIHKEPSMELSDRLFYL